MRQRIVLVAIAVAALAACHREPPTTARLVSLSSSSRFVSGPNQPDQHFKTISFKLPEGFTAEGAREATLIGEDGRVFRAKGFSLGRSSEEGETVSAEFELPRDAKPATLRMGAIEVDLLQSRVTRVTPPK